MAEFGRPYGAGGIKKGPTRNKDFPEDVVAKIDDLMKGDFIFRTSLEQTWFINHLNYMGFQWHMVDENTGTIDEIETTVNYRANKLMSAVVHSVSKVTANAPDWDVDTYQMSQGINSARNVAERYLEYVWDKENMPLRSKELVTNTRVYGTGLMYVYWDPNAGDIINPDEFFAPSAAGLQNDIDDLMEAFEGDEKAAQAFLDGELKLKTGDVKIDILNPFDFYIDEAGTDMRSARWAMVSSVKGIDELKERWGKAAKDVQPEVLGTGSGPTYKYRLKQLVSPNIVAGGTSQTRIEDACILHEYWERAGNRHPNGRYVVYANGVVLHSGENPYAHTSAELPFVRLRDLIVPDRFFGQAALEHAIPAQRDYNKGRSDLIMHSFDQAAPKVMAPRGSITKHSALNRSSSEVLEYNPISGATGQPLKPERMEGARSSPLVSERITIADSEIQEIMGVHDVSKGDVPSGVSSGVAIQLLQEGDDTRLGSLIEEMNVAFADLGMMVLDLGQKFITEERTFRAIAGDASIGEIISFMGTDLGFRNVRVRTGALLNRQRAAREQKMIELLQYGAPTGMFDAPDMRNMLLTGMGLGGSFTNPSAIHEKRALYENKMLEQGLIEKAYVTDYQNQEIHLEILEQRMNEPSFDELPPEVQAAFHNHRAEHQMILAQQQMALMSMGAGVGQEGAEEGASQSDSGPPAKAEGSE